MDLLWILLLMVLVRSEAENVMEVRGELGQDVTLYCSSNFIDIYWFMEIHNKIRAQIGQTFSSSYSDYSSPDFKTKYSMVENRLVIRNVSAEDSRLYFCGKKRNGTIVYGDTIRLISDVPVVPVSPSSTISSSKVLEDVSVCETQRLTFFVYRSALIVSLLVSLTAGLILTCWRTKRVQEEDSAAAENKEMLQTEV